MLARWRAEDRQTILDLRAWNGPGAAQQAAKIADEWRRADRGDPSFLRESIHADGFDARAFYAWKLSSGRLRGRSDAPVADPVEVDQSASGEPQNGSMDAGAAHRSPA
jgi:hypothetical protein